MNNKGKPIFINSSSLVDLKAELLKKRDLLTQAKLLRNQSESSDVYLQASQRGATKLKKIYEENVRKKNEKKTNVIEISDRVEEEDALRKSRLALERKAKLYEKISSGEHVPAEEEGELYLVNFDKKIVDSILQQKAENEEKRAAAANDEREACYPIEELNLDDIPLPPEPENQWVEYVDQLGRKKCCLKKDLEYFASQTNEEPVVENKPEVPTGVVENDDDADDGKAVYYQKLKENEIRLHGVGYYGFSLNPEEREKQMDALKKLREQTVTQRENRAKLKEKRKALIKERLAKIKKRKQITTDNVEVSSSDENDNELAEESAASKETEIAVDEAVESEKDLKRKLHVRPWDKRKNLTEVSRPGFLSAEANTLASQFKWIEEKRNERQQDFAPPDFYA